MNALLVLIRVVVLHGFFHERIGRRGKTALRCPCLLANFPRLAFFEGSCRAFQFFLALEERRSLGSHAVFLSFRIRLRRARRPCRAGIARGFSGREAGRTVKHRPLPTPYLDEWSPRAGCSAETGFLSIAPSRSPGLPSSLRNTRRAIVGALAANNRTHDQRVDWGKYIPRKSRRATRNATW